MVSFVKLAPVAWNEFDPVLRSPDVHERQMDAWSCGLFVMIAMQSFVDRWEGPLLGESAKEDMRVGALQALLNIP